MSADPNSSTSIGYITATVTPLEGDQLHDVLHGAIVGITGIPGKYVRPRWQPNPPTQPAKGIDWCAFGIERQPKQDFPVIQHDGAGDNGLGRDILIRQEMVDTTISFFGPNAYNYAQAMRDGLYIAQNSEVLSRQDIKLYETGEPLAVPTVVNADWLMRVDLSVTFIRTVQSVYQIRNIVSANVMISAEVDISTDTGLTVEAIVNPPTP